MSATTELLLEQIKQTKRDLADAQAAGQPTDELQEKLSRLNQQLDASQQALNESKLLKG